MRGCLAPPKNSAQTTGRGAAGCFFAPQTAPRRTQQGKKRASALVAVSRLLKMAATNVLLPGASKVAAQPRKGGLRRPRSVTWSVTWSVIRSINQRWVPHDWKTCLVTHRLTHPRSSPLCSSVLLCASVFQDPSLLDTQPRLVNTEAQREQSWNVELRPRVASGIRRRLCSPFAAALSFRTLALETQDSARTL
jgi:hypothetical protein